jgi:hypothetical protein
MTNVEKLVRDETLDKVRAALGVKTGNEQSVYMVIN